MLKYVMTSSGNISGFCNGKPFFITPESTNYDGIVHNLKGGRPDLVENSIITYEKLNSLCDNSFNFEQGLATFEGIKLPTVLRNRVLEIVSRGYDIEPVLNFLYRLIQNPSDHSIVELMDFLTNKSLPLTDNGYFLGFKGVRNDYLDAYTGTIDNSVGQSPRVPADQVDPCRHRECSYGLHVGDITYASNHSDRLMLVKVDAKDVVTVPTDHNFKKLRCMGYEVIAEVPKFSFDLPKPLYNVESLLKEISQLNLKVDENHKEETLVKPTTWKQDVTTRLQKLVSFFKDMIR